MAVTNEDLTNMTESTKDLYIRLRQSLDSLNNVAFAEFDLSESKDDRNEIFVIVSKGVRLLLEEISDKRGKLWGQVGEARAEDFAEHSRKLIGLEKPAGNLALGDRDLCPPGFIEKDGICVPI